MNQAKIEFVSNHNGSSLTYVLVLLLHLPLYIRIQRYVPINIKNIRSLRILCELLFILLPLCLNISIFADYIYYTFICLFMLCVLLKFISNIRGGADNKLPIHNNYLNINIYHEDKPFFVTEFKGAAMCLTCLCILFVDFHTFPRYNAKTEEYGMSLMDIGVGIFILSSGITSSFARHRVRNNSAIVNKEGLIKSVIVLILGIGRCVAIYATDYHTHVSEFGVHWNFFVTLAVIWSTADNLHTICQPQIVLLIAILMIIGYEILLTQFHIDRFVLSNKKSDSLVIQNKEGILSLLGYLPLFLWSELFSYFFIFHNKWTISYHYVPESDERRSQLESLLEFSQDKEDKSLQYHEYRHKIRQIATLLLQIGCITLIFYMCGHFYSCAPSRRMANFMYILGVLACASIVLAAMALEAMDISYIQQQQRQRQLDEQKLNKDPPSILLAAFAANQLPVFLIANVLTGMINKSTNTMIYSHNTGFIMCFIYGIFVSLVAIFLSEQNK